MSNTISPNMGLIIPTVGNEIGPLYATDINNSLQLIDQHDHSPGKGAPLSQASFTITGALSMNDWPLTNVEYVSFAAQPSAPSVIQSLSVAPASSINELWYTDSNGSQTQITKNGVVNSTASSIPGESYSAGTFIWTQTQSSLPTTPANFDIGAITIRPNVAATTAGVQLISTISSNYSITFANSTPGSPSFMAMSSSGVLSTPLTLAANAGQFLGNSGSSPVWSSFKAPTIQTFTTGASQTYTTPAGVLYIKIRMVGGGGGGGSTGTGTSGGSGGLGTSTLFGQGTLNLAAGGGHGGPKGSLGAGQALAQPGGAVNGNILNGTGNPGSSNANGFAESLAGPSGGASQFQGAGVGGIGGGGHGGNAAANSGSGGGAAGGNNSGSTQSGYSGASGGYLEHLQVSPASSYIYSVGLKGTGGAVGTGGGAGGDGADGYIIVEEYYQ